MIALIPKEDACSSSGSSIALASNGNKISDSGIIIRSRQTQRAANGANFSTQGTAPRRIRLQMKPQMGPVTHGVSRKLNSSENEQEGKPMVIKV